MNFLTRVAAALAVFAQSALAVAKAEGLDFAGKVATAAEDDFEDLVQKLGGVATKFVTDLFADNNLSGLEKANLATVQLVDHAAQNGIVIAADHATSLIHSAFLAVKAEIAKL